MSAEDQSEPKIIVDEDWKSKVEREREELREKPSGEAQQKSQAIPRFPPATFAGLVSSLMSQAAAALVDASAPPDEKEAQERLDQRIAIELARHLIDTLAVLEEKTRGNLSSDENAMLQQALHELRVAFIEVQTHRG